MHYHKRNTQRDPWNSQTTFFLWRNASTTESPWWLDKGRLSGQNWASKRRVSCVGWMFKYFKSTHRITDLRTDQKRCKKLMFINVKGTVNQPHATEIMYWTDNLWTRKNKCKIYVVVGECRRALSPMKDIPVNVLRLYIFWNKSAIPVQQ